jgi:hypothetical protein
MSSSALNCLFGCDAAQYDIRCAVHSKPTIKIPYTDATEANLQQKTLIIGISGKARAGKDTLAAALPGFVKGSFAAELKSRVMRDFNLTDAHMNGALKEVRLAELAGCSSRQLLIDYGNLFRKYNENYWVDFLMEKIEAEMPPRVAITDVRYPNEAERIKAAGGIMVRLERHTSRDRLVDPMANASISETALDDYKGFDFVLPGHKNATMEDLAKFGQHLMSEIEKRGQI